MTDSEALIDEGLGSDGTGSESFREVLGEVAREEEVPDEILALDRVLGSGDLAEIWAALRAAHEQLDRWREEGRISADGATRLRSLLLDVSLEAANRAAEAEARSYRTLLRDVSHDIRSPLHSIIFLAEALRSGRSGSLDEADRNQVGTIYAASTSLLNLVNDLLDYARTTGKDIGGLTETSFTVGSVIGDVRHLVAPLVEYYDTDYSVEASEDTRYCGDPQLLCRMLTNLVSNALEAAGRRGTVRVAVSARNNGLGVEVIDDGDGAGVSRIERLLTDPEEESLDSCVGEKRRGRTHGLGLLICGRLLKAAGGRADVTEVRPDDGDMDVEVDERTRIRVWLPFERIRGGTEST